MDKAQIQKSPTAASKQNASPSKTRASKHNSQLHPVSGSSPSQIYSASNNLTPSQLVHLQRTLGNQAVGRILQAKLTISQPDDPYEREADQVADKVMRMPEPETSGEEETQIQTKPLAGQITPLVQRMPEPMVEEEQPPVQAMHDAETEHDEETTVAAKPLIQRVPLAVREDDDEEKVAPKLETGEELQQEKEEKPVQAKPANDSFIQRQSQEDEEKKEETQPAAPMIHREMEEEKEEEIQAKLFPGSIFKAPTVHPSIVRSTSPTIQRLCTECAEEKHQEEGRPEMAQRKQARYQLHDDNDEEEQKVQPKGTTHNHTPQVTPSIASNIQALNRGGSPLPKSTRAFFEPRFGADFSGVRVHTGTQAAETAKSINAKAFTVGSNIAFGGGHFAPESSEGRRLLAHELAHVVQQNVMVRAYLNVQREESATETPVSAEDLIDEYTTLNFLDEEGLGRDLANRLPGQVNLTNNVLNELSDSDRDDVAYEITIASIGKLSSINEDLRIRLVRELAGDFVGDDEEGAIADLWISFEPNLPQVAEKNRALWKKSLWESDQLCEHIKPINDAFVWDVTGVARAFLEENKRAVIIEGKRFGISLDNESETPEEQEEYLEDIMAIASKVSLLQKDRDKLREIQVGYDLRTRYYRGDSWDYEYPKNFDPESPPRVGPKGTESPSIPTWEQVNDKHLSISSVISGFANLYPSIYMLIQQEKLDEVAQQGNAEQARKTIAEGLQKVFEKIKESDDKIISEDISYYDLLPIHELLFSGSPSPLSVNRYPWNQPYYTDIAKDDLKGHEAREFWVKLGLSLVAAAALIAAPFTGGATAAILVGLGVGIGAGQAAVSWEKYLDLATVGDAHIRDELALISQGQVTGALVDAIIDTVAVFLDAYGARGAQAGARATRAAVEAAEKELKEKFADEAKKRMLRGAVKEAGMTAAGSGLAVAQQELLGEEEPDIEATCQGYDIDLPTEIPESPPETVNRLIIQRMTGADFEVHIEGALRRNEISGLPKMIAVIPGQYTGSGHGIDRIGISIDKADRITVWHFEMKFVSPGSPHVPGLGTPKVGTQVGEAWTRKAIRGLLDSNKPEARAARERLRRAMQKMPNYQGLTVTKELMEEFLIKKVPKAPTRIIVPSYADLSRLYKQVAALIKHGRRVKIKKIP